MADEVTTTPDGGQNNTPDVSHDKPEFKPITSQEEFDKVIQNRISRAVSKFADYDDLKAKAAKFDEADAASKTEAQKLADQLAQLQKQNAELASNALRAEVSAEKGVPAKLLAGATREELEACADELLAFKGPPEGLPPVSGDSPYDGKQLPPAQIVDAALK